MRERHFLDTIARANPTPALGQIESTNPCGEVPLLPYESCNLGSINLAHVVTERDGRPSIDWERLQTLVAYGVRFLDDVIAVNRFPTEQIERMTLGNRKIGLGVMGFAELCILTGVSYNSAEALRAAGELMSFIAREARAASERLAEERGVFPNWEKSIYAQQGLRLRNATLTSIAPTGTISIIAGTSSSIEPLFALAYRRAHVLGDQTLTEFNPLFLSYLDRHKLASPQLLDSVIRCGRLTETAGAPPDLRNLFVTALDIPPERHLRIQAAFQQHVDNAVSKALNLPQDTTADEIAKIYRLAHQFGCKGVTVFRYGSKGEHVLELGVGETPYEREHFSKCDPAACRL